MNVRNLLPLIVVSLSLLLYGCQKAENTASPSGGSSTPAHDHGDGDDHEEEFHSHTVGPKGGVLAVLGHHQYHVEFLPNDETGEILALAYNDHFKPIKFEAKELTLNIMVGGQPKQFTFLVDNDGADGKVAIFKITDPALAKLLKEGWEGNAEVSVTEKGSPAKGGLAKPQK